MWEAALLVRITHSSMTYKSTVKKCEFPICQIIVNQRNRSQHASLPGRQSI